MGVAAREAAESLGEATEAKLEQRRQGDRDAAREALAAARTAEEQNAALTAFLSSTSAPAPRRKPAPKRKFEFHVGDVKVTARQRECRIVSRVDFTEVPRDRLELAGRAFKEALEGEG